MSSMHLKAHDHCPEPGYDSVWPCLWLSTYHLSLCTSARAYSPSVHAGLMVLLYHIKTVMPGDPAMRQFRDFINKCKYSDCIINCYWCDPVDISIFKLPLSVSSTNKCKVVNHLCDMLVRNKTLTSWRSATQKEFKLIHIYTFVTGLWELLIYDTEFL